MQRIGRVLRLREGVEAEYKRYHRAVWPELMAASVEAGIRNYSIFLYDRYLFSYFELPDDITLEDVYARLGPNETCQRWEAMMHQLQEPLPESGEEVWWVTIEEVFRCEGS
jgi:L-rhamnose mutarotase